MTILMDLNRSLAPPFQTLLQASLDGFRSFLHRVWAWALHRVRCIDDMMLCREQVIQAGQIIQGIGFAAFKCVSLLPVQTKLLVLYLNEIAAEILDHPHTPVTGGDLAAR